ncbi:hypothetical protein ABZ907_18525 [Nonomuraea wenchangensis]
MEDVHADGQRVAPDGGQMRVAPKSLEVGHRRLAAAHAFRDVALCQTALPADAHQRLDQPHVSIDRGVLALDFGIVKVDAQKFGDVRVQHHQPPRIGFTLYSLQPLGQSIPGSADDSVLSSSASFHVEGKAEEHVLALWSVREVEAVLVASVGQAGFVQAMAEISGVTGKGSVVLDSAEQGT